MDLSRPLDTSLTSLNKLSSALVPLMVSRVLIIVCTSSFNSYKPTHIQLHDYSPAVHLNFFDSHSIALSGETFQLLKRQCFQI